MTHEAPKEIWVGFDGRDYHPVFLTEAAAREHGWNDADGAKASKYFRATHAHALVAEAYEVAAKAAMCFPYGHVANQQIRTLTPADAQAARDALIAEVRRKALEEALGAVKAVPNLSHPSDYEWAIATLIEKDKTDE